MSAKRKITCIVLSILFVIFCVIPAGVVALVAFNPASVLRDAIAEYPAPDGQQLTESFALACADRIIAEAGLAGKLQPYEDDRVEPGDRYMLRSGITRGSIMYLHPEHGPRFFKIDLVDGTAYCELWRGL